jgi:hypothetical protein
MLIGPLPGTGHGSDHIENTSSVVLYNHPARTISENTTFPLLYDVTAYARAAWQRSVRELQKTLLFYCREFVFLGPLLGGSIRHSFFLELCFSL